MNALFQRTEEEQHQEFTRREYERRVAAQSLERWNPLPTERMWEGIPDLTDLPPPPESLLSEYAGFTAGGLTLLSAASKSRKSWLLEELAVGLAGGVGWQGFSTLRPRRVVLLDLEIRGDALARRLHTVAHAVGAFRDVLREHLRVLPWRGFWEEHKWGARVWEEAAAQIDALSPDLIVVDPIYCLLSGDENDHHAIRTLLSELRRLGESSGAAVVVSHHHAKGTSSDRAVVDRASGSGVWGRFPDAIVTLTPPHPLRTASSRPLSDALVVESVLRDAPAAEPWVTRWNGGCLRPVAPVEWREEGMRDAADLLTPPPKERKSTPRGKESPEV